MIWLAWATERKYAFGVLVGVCMLIGYMIGKV
jgi:hypothetical protein